MINAEMILVKRLGPYRKSAVGGFDLELQSQTG
jgi:hypothetical protein